MQNNTIVYPDEQKNFIKKLHNEIRRSQELWKEHVESWGDQRGGTFFVDLHYFVRVVEYAIMNNELKLATKVLDKIEGFLANTNEESRNNITYFFFETLTNSLGWQEEKYMEIFVSLLGQYSKNCCRKLDEFWGTKTPGVDYHTKNPSENEKNNHEEMDPEK
jgi:hypothetical protein